MQMSFISSSTFPIVLIVIAIVGVLLFLGLALCWIRHRKANYEKELKDAEMNDRNYKRTSYFEDPSIFLNPSVPKIKVPRQPNYRR